MNDKLLRKKAESIVEANKSTQAAVISSQQEQILLHELQVHQIELEMQNEELRREHDALEEANNLYFDLYEFAPIGYVTLDSKGNILKANITFSKLCNIPKSQLLNHPLTSLIFFDDQDIFYKHYQKLTSTSDKDSCELRMVHGDGTVFWVHLDSNVSVSSNDEKLLFFTITDITQERKSRDTIQYLADYDTLTELANRHLLKDRIGQAITASTRSKIFGAIIFVDIDHFKTLNDIYGHSVGDLLLVEIALRLRANIRESDTVGRQGGDEFILLLNNLSPDISETAIMALHLSEKLHKEMAIPFDLNGLEYHCKISMGIALIENGANVDELLQHADIALFQAKEAGRNTLRFFDPAMQEALNLQVTLESELNDALKHDELRLYYQPQVNAEGKIMGVEALIRWQHPKRGIVVPNEFIPFCEINGMILPIGDWVLHTACAQLKKWEQHPTACNFYVAVNVSAKQFRQPDYVSLVKTAIDRYKINPSLLKLELTESLILDNIVDTIQKMHELKRLGITFSMDDFGTGYSSLSYLAKLPLDQLKIDKSFVDNIPGAKSDEMITRTIITMGIELEMNVIAEGVETQIQKDFLLEHGCTTYQGYLFSRPLPIKKLEELMNS